jgi:hypothetical protein
MAFWRKQGGSTEYLQRLSFFEGFDAEELARVAQLGREVEFSPNTVIIDQGSVGQVCFVLVEGSASVYIAGEHVATLEAGSLVGEMALVDHRPRRATVVSSKPAEDSGVRHRGIPGPAPGDAESSRPRHAHALRPPGGQRALGLSGFGP